MKRILEDVQLLACEQGMKTATRDQQKEIRQAIEKIKVITCSVPEEMYGETTFAASNFGTGTLFNTQGGHQYIAQSNASQYNSGGGPQNFGRE